MLIEAKGENVPPLRDKAPNLDWERLRWHAERVVSENGPLGEFWALLEEWVEGYFAENAISIWRKLTERAATRLYFGELWLFCALLSSSCYGMPLDIVSDRDPRFTARFWQKVFTLLGTQLSMSTADHPQSDGQTERVNRVLGDLLKSYAYSFQQWSDCLPMAEFAINNSNGGFLLKWGGSTVASEQPQKSADTDTVSAMTARRQAPSRSGNETTDKNYGSVQGTDTVTKDNTSVQGTDSAQVGPVAKTTEIRGNHGSS
ncbi:hypothetical protein PC113_g13278 [Phytophthora cactorum]|uniref:Integrase catalytic domain-containing protein n=1 Tax=Phytophthora cactorum TaxID=29920 RepID=A0A8T0YXT4_9STRA|nr:hypothetical protein PC111_g11568 [Phytophthora cactorum]KAG2854476.1 hypothetical protein PC113_g13278 [Phytophthora cactorum]